MNADEIEQEIEKHEKFRDDWKGTNKYIYKKHKNKIQELQKELKELESEKEKESKKVKKSKSKKKKPTKKKKKYHSSDVNENGKVDFKDAFQVAKDAVKGDK